MKPAPFSYYRATSIDDAVAVLVRSNGTARILAGGQSLVPMLNLRLAPVDKLVDIRRIEELRGSSENADSIHYGALITHAEFEDRRVPDATNGLIPFIAGRIAYRAVRTRGTIGGSIAMADPSADWLLTAMALDAKIAIVGPNGRRSLEATGFVSGPYMTVLDESEIIEAIVVPRRSNSERWGYYKMTRKTGEYADSMALALTDVSRATARVMLGRKENVPMVLADVADALLTKRRYCELWEIVRDEISARDASMSTAKLILHTAVVMRAIKDATAE
jgi:carbon-monoxide dehydrogenase medium subunit